MKNYFQRVGIYLVVLTAISSYGIAQVSLTPGTIPSFDSIVVYHDVTINTTSLPAGFNRIASRGTVAGTGVSVLTDDPDTAPADSTITVVNRVPVFANGASVPFSICQNASAQSISALFTAGDDNPGQTLMWTVTSAPTNGTLSGFPANAPSGSNVTPAGLTYQPATGYIGSDAFTIQVSDGFDGVSITVNVTVTAPVANNSASSNQIICPGNTPAQLTGLLPTGGTGTYTYLWESSTTSAATGFAPAAGTNNTQDYQPGATSAPTWFRRTVTSGSCAASVSSAAAISITNANVWTGTASTAWSNSANWSCGTLPTATTDVVIPAVATQPIVDITTAAANTLTINTGANLQFSAASSRLDVYGAITAAGTFDAQPGTVGFRSTATQNIPAGTYSNIVINGTGNKTLDGAATVEETLTLTSGKVALGAANLTVGSAGSISGGTSASYIITDGAGRLVQQGIGVTGKTGAVLFPVGSSATSYTPAILTNAGTLDNFSGAVIPNVYGDYTGETPSGSPITSNVVNKTWLITEGTAGGSSATLALTWNGGDETTGFTRSNCQVSHYTGGTWNPSSGGAATGVNPYSRVRTGITSFSPFGVGSAGSPLPLELLAFSGSLQGKEVHLRWETANEESLTRFDVERSLDGVAYRSIGQVDAAGKQQNKYHFEDGELPAAPGTLLYRLKVAGRDGGWHYSNTVAVRIGDAAGSIIAYPNPVLNDVLYLNTTGSNHTSLSVTILDAAGRKWSTQEASADALKAGVVPVSVKGLPPGVYLLKVTDEKGWLESVRFTRQ